MSSKFRKVQDECKVGISDKRVRGGRFCSVKLLWSDGRRSVCGSKIDELRIEYKRKTICRVQ